MNLQISYSKQTKSFLRKLDKIKAKRIIQKIRCLQTHPVPKNSKTLEGTKELLYRIRVGEYRVIYDLDYKNQTIGIVKIDKRERVY